MGRSSRPTTVGAVTAEPPFRPDPTGAVAESPRFYRMRPTYISWAPYCSRSDSTARELGGRSYMVYREELGSRPSTVALKYALQARDTFRILATERPDVVFVMSPPVIAVLTVWLWCAWHRKSFVVDAHTAAFLHPRWRKLQWLHNALCRRAVTTIVTNDHLAGVVRTAGAHATILRDVPVEFPTTDAFDPGDQFAIAVVCSFNSDEPIGEIFDAAALVPDVRFLVTGNPKHLDPALLERVPRNVTLTGFLSTEAYGSLIAKAGAVLTLTTRDHTMLRGAYEAVYQGTPVIVSNWPLLRDAFERGAIHVENSATAIAGAVLTMRDDHQRFQAEARELRATKLARWRQAKASLLSRLRTCTAG